MGDNAPVPIGPEDSWRTVLVADAAIRTGLVAELAAPVTPDEAAAARGLAPRAVRVVCAAMQDLGLAEAAGDGRVTLSAAGRRLLGPAPDGADPDADIGLTARAIAAHTGLAERLRGGPAVDDVSGGDEATRARFMRAMRHVAAPRVARTVEALGPPAPGARLLDVGGAPGSYARGFAAAGWRVTVLDLPETLALSRERLEAGGIAAVAGDALAGLPPGPWDAVYLGNVLHLLSPGDAEALVARAAAALAPGGILAVQEVVGGLSTQAPGFAVLMLMATPEGEVHDEAAYRRWMESARCPVDRLVALGEGEHHLLVGRRAA